MFMFRKKEVKVSTTEGLQLEAKRFQQAVAEINSNYTPASIDIALIDGISLKFEVEPEFLLGAFESYLRNNAIQEVRRVKANSDYTYYDLEQATLKYGFELDDLQITFYSEE